ncbi:MAG: DUF2911 domain-containing protein [Bryobacteraceae bacterium]|nr:DUF2911 domain-containing protein [Bryobacteraceae bacterium]
MKKVLAVLSALALVAVAQEMKKKTPASPPMETTVTLGGEAVSIKYSAPSMKGRKIFGGLVPYGQVWRAGANAATALNTGTDLMIGKLMVPKGSYTLYVWPTAEGMQLIVNKQTGQWGTEYSEGQDLGRVPMKVGKTAAPVEVFKITLSGSGKKGMLELEWENTTASVPVTVK